MSTVQALQRGLEVLTAVAKSHEPIGVSEVGRLLDINKASVSRFLATLAELDFVEKDPKSGKYRIGAATLGLVPRKTFESELISRAQSHLEAIRDLTDETVGLYVRDGLDRVCIHSVESRQELRRNLRLGDRNRLTLGSTGRAFLAFMPSSEATSLVESIGLTKETPQTTVDYAKYIDELAEVRKRGAAMTISQTILGVSGLSLPVLDANGRALAVVSISGPSARWTLQRMEAVVDRCKDRTKQIATELGLGNAQQSAQSAVSAT